MTDVIIPAAAGLAGDVVKEVAKKIPDWLVNLVRASSPKLQQRAMENMSNFLVRLARRVEMLETELVAQGAQQILYDALEDPGAYLLLRNASITAGATENDDRHAILAELIAQRLAAAADDRVALAGGAACEVIGSLSSMHIALLGLLVTAHRVRPSAPFAGSQDQYHDWCTKWWHRQMSAMATLNLMKASTVDLDHLVGMSCLWINLLGPLEPTADTFKLPCLDEGLSPLPAQSFQNLPWYGVLHHVWKIGGGRVNLSSVGLLIGILYHDNVLKARTTLGWEG